MEEQEIAFVLGEYDLYQASPTEAVEIAVGQTYTVKWDGTEYICVSSLADAGPLIGNLSFAGAGDDTGEPFAYLYIPDEAAGQFATFDTSASHTISVKTTAEIVTPIAEEFLPNIPADKLPAGGSADAVLYTPQTLTDAQKKQARDNIDAASDFVTAITLYENDPERASFDKTYDEISAAVSAGKRVFARVQFDGVGDVEYYPLTAYSPFGLDFFRENSYGYGIGAYTISLNPEGIGTVRYEKAVTLNSDNSMPQQTMASAPTKDMQIATKKYVDDHATGGIDMGITGAAVGQIAKITSVDASGTPIAWEPADMPSGGGATTYDIAATASHGGTNQALQDFACSVSSKQLRKAIDAGKTPRLVITIGTLNPLKMYMPMTYYFPVGTEYAYACFGCIGEGFPGAYLYYVICEGESESESGRPNWLARSFEATPATS